MSQAASTAVNTHTLAEGNSGNSASLPGNSIPVEGGPGNSTVEGDPGNLAIVEGGPGNVIRSKENPRKRARKNYMFTKTKKSRNSEADKLQDSLSQHHMVENSIRNMTD